MSDKTVKTSWELWSYDVWGNATDGYDVNDRFCFNRAYDINATIQTHNVGTDREFQTAVPSDYQIKRAFGISGKIETTGDDTHIYIEDSKGYPLGEMNCISHSSLSPIGEEYTNDIEWARMRKY